MAFGAALLVASTALGACNGVGATPTLQQTAVPLAATPWPSGTTGQYGLHVDPSLLGKLPPFVHAQPIVEDATSEGTAMDNADLAKTFDGYAAASVGQMGYANWLEIAIGHFRPEIQNSDTFPDTYSAWVSEYDTGACSQASGVSTTSQIQIGDWDPVDQGTCVGGLFVYTVSLGNGVVLSMFGDGPLDYGRLLIQALY
ncbi:MAG: hypothetical protein ABSE58_10545 [Candidatus Limnocylindrales bacterium]|jgi:hypothetical protein